MQTTTGFDLKLQLQEFERRVLSSPEVTPRDCQDLQVHLLDCMDEYKAKGIDEEEAFLLALNKVGDKSSWDDGFSEANSGLIQVKRALGLLGGVFFYFLLYSLLLVMIKSLLYVGGRLHIDTGTLYQFSKYYFQAVYFLTILGIIILAMREIWFLTLLKKVYFNARKIILLFIVLVILAPFNRLIGMAMKGLLTKDIGVYIKIETTFIWFEYLFPLIFCAGFIVIYLRYFKDTKKEK